MSTALVLLAVWGESDWATYKLIPEHANDLMPIEAKRKRFKKKCEFALIIGIAGELACLPLSLFETAALNKEAGEAIRQASEADARAKKFDLARIAMEQTVEELRRSNLELAAKLQPRIITQDKLTNFIFLTQLIPKFPIRVEIGAPRDETLAFAADIREMLDQAGFGNPDQETNLVKGVFIDTTAITTVPFGKTNTWDDVMLITDNATNDSPYQFFYEITNSLLKNAICLKPFGGSGV